MKYIKTFEDNTEKYLDMNGRELHKNDWVMMPEPKDFDDWQYEEFEAEIIDFYHEYIVVKDMDDDTFMIIPERVYNVEDEWYIRKYKPEGISYEKAEEIESYNL